MLDIVSAEKCICTREEEVEAFLWSAESTELGPQPPVLQTRENINTLGYLNTGGADRQPMGQGSGRPIMSRTKGLCCGQICPAVLKLNGEIR